MPSKNSARPVVPGIENFREFVSEIAILADSFARPVGLAISQPEEMDVSEILSRATRQEL